MTNISAVTHRYFLKLLLAVLLCCPGLSQAQSVNSIPLSSLPQNSRLAIWGDSITEVTYYPQYTEAYLLACAGRKDIKVMTFGHSGETLQGMLNRQVDLQAFNPTVLSFNYGMNDSNYNPYTTAKGMAYDQTMQQVLAMLVSKGITQRIVAGPDPVDDTFDADNPSGFWGTAPTGGLTAAQGQNVNLSNFSAFGRTEAVNTSSFDADIYDRMNNTNTAAEAVLGSPYAYGAPHPEPNGHLMITYELLKTLACTGNIGTVTVNMSGSGSATATTGHTVASYSNGTVILDSTQYPFCYNYNANNYQGASGLASVLPFLPFSQDLNRFMLVVTNLGASSANVTWGGQTVNFTSAQLSAGVNLTAAFTATPFDATFAQVMNEILLKDNFEDFEIKGTSDYNGNDNGGNVDSNMIAVQAQYDAAVKALIVPVRHTIVIVPTGASTAVAPVITGTMMAYPTVGQYFSYQISILGSASVYTATGLPNGLTLSSSGLISGTPTTTGITVVPISATNSYGPSLTTNLTFNVQTQLPYPPSLTYSSTASATVGTPFTYQIVASNNPTNYFVVSPSSAGTEPPTSSLPPGLTYNTTTGVFSGTPTTAGVYNIEISAMNAGGVTASYDDSFVLTITPAGGGAPPAPGSLAATPGSGQVTLSWSASAGAASYSVYRGTSAGGESTTALASGITTTTYTDTTATNGTTYYYVVKAVNSSGTSSASNEVSASPTSNVPAAPTGLTAVPGNASVTVSWIASSGATSYNIYRGTSPGGENVTPLASGIPELSYYDVGTGLSNGTTYYYEVKAVNANGTSSYSSEISATPTAGSVPSAPTGLTATAGSTQVTLNWTASSGATSYNLYRSTTSGGEGTTAIVSGITTTSYINTGLTNGTAYYYKVAAVDSAGTSTQSSEASATPAAASNILANGTYQVVNLNSSLSLGAAGTATGSAVQQQTYTGAATQQWVLTNLGSNVVEMAVSGTSEAMEVIGASTAINANLDIISYTGATNQQWTITPTSGYIEIVNVNSGLAANVPGWQTQSGIQLIQYYTPYSTNQAWTFTAAGGSAPSAPTSLTATPGNGTAALSWTASSGATSYNVYRGTSAGGESTTAIATGVTTTTYSDSSLTNGTTYYYKVKAVNANGTSGYSNEANATPTAGSAPAAPTGLTATAASTQVTLNWTASSGATSYNVYRSTTSGGEGTTALVTGITTTSYVNTGLTNGTTYYYKVAAVNSVGTSSQSSEASATPSTSSYIEPNGTYQVVNLNSSLSLGATGTTTGSAVQQQTYTGAATQKWVVTNLGSNVVEMAVSGTSEAMEVIGASTAINANLDITAYTGATNQQWTITPTSGYIEIVNVNSGLAANVPGWQTQSGIQLIQYYTPYSTNQAWTFTLLSGSAPAAPTGLAATPGNTTAALSWTASSGATSYNVYRGTSAGGESTTAIATGVTTTTYSDSSLTNGTTYYYEVKAVNANGTSGYSNEASATPIGVPAAPAGLTATAGNAQVTLNWTAATGATSYNVYRSTTSGGEGTTALVTGITTTSYTNTSLTNGTAYYYKVAAVNSAGTSSQSTEASATPTAGSPPSAPTGLTATAGNTTVALSWTASTGATSYNLYRGTSSGTEGSTAIVTGITTTTYSNTGLTNGTAYYYKVAAVNSAGTSGYSNEATATPSGSSYLVANGTYNVVGLNSGLSLGAAGTTTGSQVQQQTYTGAATQKWVVTNLGSNVVEMAVSGTSEAMEVIGASTAVGAFLDITSYTAATNQQWTLTPTNGYLEIVNVNSGLAANVPGYQTQSGVQLSQYYTPYSANQAWTFTSPGAPSAPTGLTATGGNTQVALSWTASTGATSYSVYSGTAAGAESPTALVTGLTTTTYTNTGLTNGTTYFYKVVAVNSSGSSPSSAEASAMASAGAYVVANGTYKVINLNSGLALGAAATTSASQVQQQTYGAAATQKWVVNNLGSNVVTMEVSGTTEAMEVVGAGTSINNLLDITSYTGATNQQWTMTPLSGYIEMVNVNSGLAANVPGWSTNPGTQLIQYNPGYSTNQVWTFSAP